MKRQLITTVLFLFYACLLYAQKSVKHHIAPSGNPMSCFIEGRVLSIHPVETFHSHIRQPYKVRVKLLAVSHCGSSVPMALNPGNIVEIVFPAAKHLKKGDRFMANAEERLHISHRPDIWVYDYELK